MTLSKFTEHLPGSNKVCYPISGRNDFTVVLRSVVGRQNYIYEKYPLYTVYDVFLKKFPFLVEIDRKEFTDSFKLTNEIPNVKGNMLCEKCLFCINFICLMTISSQGVSPLWYRTRYKRHTFSAICFSIRNYIKILSCASLRSSRLAVLLNIFLNFSQSILMEVY